MCVHMRTRNERPRHPARWGDFSRLLQFFMLGDFPEFIDKSSGQNVLPLIANGDFFTHRQMDSFQRVVRGVLQGPVADADSDGVCVPMMIGRGAFWDVGLFGKFDDTTDEPKETDSLSAHVSRLARFSELAVDSGTLLS